MCKAVVHRKKQTDQDENQKLANLQKDLTNSASHVFGEHKRCKEIGYFCTGPKEGEKNYVTELRESGIYQQIMKHISHLADNSRSLPMNMNNNPVEHLNSIIAKFIGGKRVNYAKKRSYKARCSAAVVSHNTRLPLYKLYKSMYEKSPGKVLKSLQAKRVEKTVKAALRRKVNPSKRKKHYKSEKEKLEDAKDYGVSAQKPDMNVKLYKKKANEFLNALVRNESERADVERGTLLQAGSGRWKEERRKLLTASNFGLVCRRRKTTSCENLVKSLLYTDVDCLAMRYGRDNEANAIEQFQEKTGLRVKKCGLFIDKDVPYLGATPDGLIGTQGIIEVKCPASCKNLTPDEAILKRKFNFFNNTTIGGRCKQKAQQLLPGSRPAAHHPENMLLFCYMDPAWLKN